MKTSLIIQTFYLSWLAMSMQIVAAGELPTPNNFGGDFSLESTQKPLHSISEWRGKPVLLTFGFTSCPDICPMVMSKLSFIQNQLDPSGDDLQVVFVTVDPERDSIEKIRDYLKHYHQGFVGMRGAKEEFKKILKSYGGSTHSEEHEGQKEVSHTDYVYLINADGYVAGFYNIERDYEAVLKAVREML